MGENEKNYLDWEGLLEYHENLEIKLSEKANTEDLADVATSGDYNDLDNTPTNVSLFTNDAGYITSEIDNTNGHDYVEIGGIKWATMNIGAENITDIGLYFQWGDILGYTSEEVGVDKNFTWEDYKFNPSGDGTTFSKYNSTDLKTSLDTEDDAAANAWGSDWRVPTTSELQTLSNAVNVSWTNNYEDSGVPGLILTDKEDSSKVLFLPATGVCNDGSIIDDDITGFYWSKSLGNTDDKGLGLGFDKTNGTTWEYSNSRSLGFTVRPVLEGPAKRTIMGVTQEEKDSWNSKVSGIRIGESGNVNIPTNGIVTLPKQEYSLPIASANTLGGVKVGDGLSIDSNGVLSANVSIDVYTREQTDTLLAGKVDKVTGKGLSTNDFDNTAKDKLDGIEDGAEVNVQSDWNATSGDALILNKPTIPAAVTESTVSGWGFTKNTGTITGITMNGSSKGTSGVVNLGTVITAHLDISGKADKATTLSGYGITDAYTKTEIDTLTRHTRKTDFDLSILKQAVADQNLEKYGLRVGDQKTINGYTYVIADLNTMKGTSTPYRLTLNHVGLIVIPHIRHAWNSSGRTNTGANSRGAGYKNCDLHDYLKNTVLPHAKNDLGAANLLAHSKLLTNAVNTTGYNRFGKAEGCSSSWEWVSNLYISALSEVLVYGSIIWSSSGYDTGEACRLLEVFKKYSYTEIFGSEYPWLRDIVSVSYASYARSDGHASYDGVSNSSYWVAGLLLFH